MSTFQGGPIDGADILRKYDFTVTRVGMGLQAEDVPDDVTEFETGITFVRDACVFAALLLKRNDEPGLASRFDAILERLAAKDQTNPVSGRRN
ncbi:hypothetical protein [Rhodococcus sp. B10]|uniref:hypothetical protein n=1 Tax=Rhodococcus sp. B10 TaxID=2695876 RepID=UPI00142F5F4E|nr:hypothetical protein [Rhodococcus sp. B10]NIL76776.1 hypothetical protein [Rhodococcus sp. B10]